MATKSVYPGDSSRMQLFCRRLLPPLPYSWELSFSETTASPYTQLSLTTCNLANVPKLRDGHGHLGEIGGEESYQIADSLLLDEVDEEVAKAPRADAANGRFSSLAPASNVECKKAQRSSSACDMSEPAEDSSEKAGGDDRGHAELSTPEPHAVVMRVLQPPPSFGSTVCASLRLASNHIAFVEPRAFGGLSYLRALDLSLNHLTGEKAASHLQPLLHTVPNPCLARGDRHPALLEQYLPSLPMLAPV